MDDTARLRIRSALEDIAEELADMGRAKLGEAIDTDSAQAEADERILVRARRAVLKAVTLLGDAPAGEDDI